MPDAHKNFAYSTIAVAPSPASSGTSLQVQGGDGARFATPPFNAIVCPAGLQPLPSNAEIVRVTGIATDTFTIVRTQEGTSARTIVVGDQIYAGPTAKSFTDIEAREVRGRINANGTVGQGSGFTVTKLGTGYYQVDFTTPFATVPIVLVSAIITSGGYYVELVMEPTVSRFSVYTWGTSEADHPVNFSAKEAT